MASRRHELSGEKPLTVVPYTPDGSIICQILVTDLPDGVAVDDITDYFENPKHSGGGPVMTTDLSDVLHKAVVTFAEPSGKHMHYI